VTWALLLSDDDDQEIVARFDAVLGLECSGASVAVRGGSSVSSITRLFPF